MRKGIFLILIAVLLLITAYTNPSRDDYSVWFNEQASQKGRNALEKALFSFGGKLIAQNCTTEKDFVFFSIYDTKLGNEHIKVIGFLNNFIPIENK